MQFCLGDLWCELAFSISISKMEESGSCLHSVEPLLLCLNVLGRFSGAKGNKDKVALLEEAARSRMWQVYQWQALWMVVPQS